jgi:hypothetical protein
LQQFHRREDEMCRPVRPGSLQTDRDPPIAQPAEAALADRRAADVLAQALDPLTVAGFDMDGGMQVEATIMGVKRDVALDPRRIRVGADPHGTPACARAEGGPTEDRRLRKTRQRRRLVREQIGVFIAACRTRESQALEPPPDPPDDAADVVICRWRGRMEA